MKTMQPIHTCSILFSILFMVIIDSEGHGMSDEQKSIHEKFLKSLRKQNEIDKNNCGMTTFEPDIGNFVCDKRRHSNSLFKSSFHHHHHHHHHHHENHHQVVTQETGWLAGEPVTVPLPKGGVPSHVLIECGIIKENENGKKVVTKTRDCNGILIGKEFVLTTVGCIDKVGPNSYCKLIFGHNDGKTDSKEIQVRWSTFHCELKKISKNEQEANDVAILLMNKPVMLTRFVQPACLDSTKIPEKGYCGSVGYKKHNGNNGGKKLVVQEMLSTCLDYDGNHDTDYRTCFTSAGVLCNDNIGTGLYCLDTCSGRVKQYAMGLLSFRDNSAACNSSTTIKWGFFSDFKKLSPILESTLANCQFPKSRVEEEE